MNFKKIASLILAVLMVLSMLPLALISATAETTDGDAAPAPVPGTAPATLPNGDIYTSTSMFVDPNATITKSTYNGANWIGDADRLVTSVSHLNNAAGVMFKVDSSAIAEGTDTLGFRLLFEVIVGETADTWAHLSMNAGGAAWYGRNKAPAGTTSTWYYSEDGATWSELVSDAMNMPVTANRGEAYVYVPFSAMWYDASLAEIKGEVASPDATLPAASYDEVKAAGFTNLTTNGAKPEGTCRVRLSYDNNSMAEAALTNWTFVYKYVEPTPTSPTPPATLPDGETFVGTNFIAPTFDLMGTYRTKTEANGKDFSQTFWPGNVEAKMSDWIKAGAKGVMFKIDTNKATAIDEKISMVFAIQIAFADRSTYLVATPKQASAFSEAKVKDGAVSNWYYSQDGETWNTIEHGTGAGYVDIPAGKGYTFVYVPMDAFWTKCGETFLATGTHAKDADGKVTDTIVNWNDALQYFGADWKLNAFNFYFGGNASKNTLEQDPATTITELKVVKFGIPGQLGAQNPPAMLPTEEPYKLIEFEPGFVVKGNACEGKENDANGAAPTPWNGFWFASDKRLSDEEKIDFKETGIEIQNAKGIMFKFDLNKSQLAGVTDALKMTIEFAVNAPGKSTYFLADPHFVTAYGGKLDTNSANSTWYFSLDGATWDSVTKGKAGSGVTLTNELTMGYVYIPLNQFWTKGYTSGDNGKRASEALAEMGAEAKITDMKIRLNNAGVSCDPNTVISEISVVKSAYCMTRETVSIGDTLAWNVYVAAPATYRSPKMTFTIDGQSIEAKAEKFEDGSLKYSLTGLSAKDVSKQITAVWTAIDDKGAAYSETCTTTIEEYLRTLLASEANAAYVGLINSLLHYAAAFQAAEGQEGDLANKDIPALESNVDISRLKYQTYDNSNPDLWGKPVLTTMDGVTTLKIAVNAPAGYNKVRFETANGRVGSVDIVDGYAYIPVYAHEMRLDVNMQFYKSGSVNTDSYVRVSLNYLIFENYAAEPQNEAVIQALVNFCNEARKLKY